MRFAGRLSKIIGALVIMVVIVFLAVNTGTTNSVTPVMLAAAAALLGIVALLLKILGGIGLNRAFYLSFAAMTAGVLNGLIISFHDSSSNPALTIILSGITLFVSGLAIIEDFRNRPAKQAPANAGRVVRLVLIASVIALLVVAYIVLTHMSWKSV